MPKPTFARPRTLILATSTPAWLQQDMNRLNWTEVPGIPTYKFIKLGPPMTKPRPAENANTQLNFILLQNLNWKWICMIITCKLEFRWCCAYEYRCWELYISTYIQYVILQNLKVCVRCVKNFIQISMNSLLVWVLLFKSS